MRYELRPMSFADLLDGAFKLYRDHLWVFVGVAAVVHVPLAILSGFMVPRTETLPPDAWLRMGLYVMIAWFAYFLQSVALTAVVADAYLGRPVSIGGGYARARAVLGPLLAATLVMGLGVALGLMLLLIPGILLALRWMLYSQVIVVEGGAAGRSLRRSADLTRGVRWRLLGLTLAIALLSFILAVAVGAVIPDAVQRVPVLGSLLGEALPQMVVSPLSAAVFTLVYFDARIRKEGFDLEVLAREVLGEAR